MSKVDYISPDIDLSWRILTNVQDITQSVQNPPLAWTAAEYPGPWVLPEQNARVLTPPLHSTLI